MRQEGKCASESTRDSSLSTASQAGRSFSSDRVVSSIPHPGAVTAHLHPSQSEPQWPAAKPAVIAVRMEGLTSRLWRPVGTYELRLIADSGFRAFPPRLPEQPIFYPVCNPDYAAEIATRWNLEDPNSGFAGFVTGFEVPAELADRYPRRVVGAARHEELWVPSEDLAAFCSAFNGPIVVERGWLGERFPEVAPWSGPVGELNSADLEDVVRVIGSKLLKGGPLTQVQLMDSLPVLTIDGSRFDDLEGFLDEVSRALVPGAFWARNLDAFNDILRGGFGTPEEGFVLRWTNSERSKHALGHAETLRWLDRTLRRCNPSNVPRVRSEIEAARAGRGPTLFNILVEIIRIHGDGGDEAEDGVVLVLE